MMKNRHRCDSKGLRCKHFNRTFLVMRGGKSFQMGFALRAKAWAGINGYWRLYSPITS